MTGRFGIAIAAAAFAFAISPLAPASVLMGTEAQAQSGAAHPMSGYYRGYRSARSSRVVRGPQVRGYSRRVGGYSFYPEDTINTYGDSRTRYGSNNVFRDPMTDRQTRFGPLDHGFFFDSGIAPRGGYSPYHN